MKPSFPQTAALFTCLVLSAVLAWPSFAITLWQDEDSQRHLDLDVAFKATALASRAPSDSALYPSRNTAVGLQRTRLDLRYSDYPLLDARLAYEQRMRWQSKDAADIGILPSEAKAPFRVAQLDWQILREGREFFWRHEIDRALVAFHPDWGRATVGRQAIGFGRGRLFSAVDVFAPFSPAEVDREWRRGVDAARAEYRLTDTMSAEGVAAFGETWNQSAVLGRVRGHSGPADGELLLGKRGRDLMAGFVTSATWLDAAFHAEAAFFRTPERQPEDRDLLVAKGLAGASYMFDIGDGLNLLGEYHYSGFGIKNPKDAVDVLAANRRLRERFERGDSQTLGRHNVGLQASYPATEDVSAAMLFLVSARDGSGLASPSAVWDVRHNATLIASAFVPWGRRPSGGRLRSEYGGTPASLFLQLNLYF